MAFRAGQLNSNNKLPVFYSTLMLGRGIVSAVTPIRPRVSKILSRSGWTNDNPYI